jgi:hypothetical protein
VTKVLKRLKFVDNILKIKKSRKNPVKKKKNPGLSKHPKLRLIILKILS